MPRSGSETSSPPATSPRAKSTPVQLSMFDLTTCGASRNATSSQASPDGHMPAALPGGRMTVLSGPDHVLATRSVSPAAGLEPQTSVISGPPFSTSSEPADLLSSWENRLRTRLPMDGLMKHSMTWRQKTTPAGRSYSQLVVSKRRTKETGYGLLPTPQAMDAKGFSMALCHKYRKTGHLKHWLHGTAWRSILRLGKALGRNRSSPAG